MHLPQRPSFAIAAAAKDGHDGRVPSPARTLLRRPASLVAGLFFILLLVRPPVPAAAAQPWLRPVPGEVVRPYDYAARRAFVAGAHRGVDLAASPGTVVRAACGGRVLHAGAVASLGRVVTVLCGGRRVTYMPLATVAVRSGTPVFRGARIGTVAPGHGGLHVGVRRAGDRWGYEDPLARMGSDGPWLPVVARPETRAPRPSAPGARPPSPSRRPAVRAASPASGPRTAPALPRPTLPGPAFSTHAHAHHGTAPLPIWLGAALVLAGTARSFTVTRRHRRAVAARAGVPARAAR